MNRFNWTKNGQSFNPHKDSRLITYEESGSFLIPSNKDLAKYQGKYRCYASNKLGTAVSEETDFIVPGKPLSTNTLIKATFIRLLMLVV